MTSEKTRVITGLFLLITGLSLLLSYLIFQLNMIFFWHNLAVGLFFISTLLVLIVLLYLTKTMTKTLWKYLTQGLLVLSIGFWLIVGCPLCLLLLRFGGSYTYQGQVYYYEETLSNDPYYLIHRKDNMITMSHIGYYTQKPIENPLSRHDIETIMATLH